MTYSRAQNALSFLQELHSLFCSVEKFLDLGLDLVGEISLVLANGALVDEQKDAFIAKNLGDSG